MSRRRAVVSLVSWLAATSGWTELRRRRRHRRGDFRVFILEYHDITESEERESVVSRARFNRHLRHLGRDHRLTSLGEAIARLQSGSLRRDLAVVTFDDGLAGNAEHAWPVLREVDAPATIFLTTGFLDGRPLWFDIARRALEAAQAHPGRLPTEHRLETALGEWPPVSDVSTLVRRLKYHPAPVRRRATADLAALELPCRPAARPIPWETVREMLVGGIEIGAHTLDHPILSLLDTAEQHREIVGSRDRILEMTGHLPTLFAYPNGSARDFDATSVDILRRSGFTAACTTIRGANAPGRDPFRLLRLGVGSDSTAVLDARLAGLFDEGLRARLRSLKRRTP